MINSLKYIGSKFAYRRHNVLLVSESKLRVLDVRCLDLFIHSKVNCNTNTVHCLNVTLNWNLLPSKGKLVLV